MNIKTGLFGLGLLVAAGAVTVSCGGSDGDTDDSGGSSSTAGTTATAGSSNGGNSNGTAGSTNGTAGTNNNNGGNSNGTAGTNNNNGGNTNGGRNNQGGEGPIFGGGEGNIPGCPATQPADGSDCERTMQNRFGCPYGNIVCQCQGQQDNRTWSCEEPQGFGGAGPDLPQADSCPDNAMTGNDCEGDGQCPGQQCWCNDGSVFCIGGMP